MNNVLTIGSLLQNLVRHCVDPIDTRRNISVNLSLDWRCNNDANDDAVDNRRESRGGRWPLNL